MSSAQSFFREDQIAAIKEAVAAAELQTSGEVRVYIESECGSSLMDRAADVFAKLDLHKTTARNGVLFYLAVDDRQFAILGDEGIHAKVPADFWDSIKEDMQAHFRAGEFTEGLTDGILTAGEKLKEHFPHEREDINELLDDVVFG
jgi:uncharacterized membrane protein